MEIRNTPTRGTARRLAGAVLSLALVIGPASLAMADGPTAEEQAKTLEPVPEGARQYYDGYWYSTNIVANPFANWEPHSPPWKICHNDSYLGNAWRANLVAELQALTKQLADQGLAEPELNVTNSNGDINLELTQLKTQIAQGCDLIMAYPGSATGLCAGIKDAFDKGILVVTIDAPVTCPEALNVGRNSYYYAKVQAGWIIDQLGGKGNLALMNGQPGTADTVAERDAFTEAAAKYPDIDLIGDIYGMWTGSVAKSEMLKFLATHPQKIDAVASTGNMGVGVGQAFAQSGRDLPIVTEVTNNCDFLAFWKEKNLNSFTLVQDGGPTGYEAFVAALHAMSGQKPKVNTIFFPLPVITNDNIDDYYTDDMTVQSACFANGEDLHLVPDDYFDQFFTGGKPAPKVDIVATSE